MNQQELTNLKRFGCTWQRETDQFCINVVDIEEEQARATIINVKPVITTYADGALVSLAFEISPTRVLPRYCFFPFDLTDPNDLHFLERLAASGLVRLSLLVRTGQVLREHLLKPAQCERIREMQSEGIAALQQNTNYSFSFAVDRFESAVWLPQLFERSFAPSDFPKFAEFVRERASVVPSETRQLALQICREATSIFTARLGGFTLKHLELLQTVRAGLLVMQDVKKQFEGDDKRFVDFFADCVALNVQDENVLRAAMEWLPKIDASLAIAEKLSVAIESDQGGIRSDVLETLAKILGDVASGRQVSLSMLQSLFVPFRPVLSSQPGRPAKDYSREYAWKAKMSWTDVATKSLQENEELRAEFGGRSFDSLDYAQRDSLRERIREGVKNWAERNGKPYPIPREDSEEIEGLEKIP
jgi:hypothetical protein